MLRGSFLLLFTLKMAAVNWPAACVCVACYPGILQSRSTFYRHNGHTKLGVANVTAAARIRDEVKDRMIEADECEQPEIPAMDDEEPEIPEVPAMDDEEPEIPDILVAVGQYDPNTGFPFEYFYDLGEDFEQ
jgi:hypothetical protein